MRKIGFALLIAGFAWLCWDPWSMRPIARTVVATHSEHLPRTGRTWLSPDDVKHEMHDVVFDAIDHIPSVLIPAGMMLVGGPILGFARRSAPGAIGAG
jgi:hypothetical protein